MSFSTFFTKQARKPSGLFGRFVMSRIFDIGNAYLNAFVFELLKVRADDRILDIGCGTGKLISKIAGKIDDGYLEGVDFSATMVSIAQRRNQRHIKKGRVNIMKGNFDELSFENRQFDKVCTVNTVYFWQDPEKTAGKAAGILKPGGAFVVGFEDSRQLEQRNLNNDIFKIYSIENIKEFLVNSGFSSEIKVESRTKDTQVFHCAVAIKPM